MTLPRGVWRAPFLSPEGFPLLLAIAANGRCLHEARLFRGDEQEEIAAMLERLLDKDDPIRVARAS